MKRTVLIHYAWVILAVCTMVVMGALGLARFGYAMVLPAMQSGLGMRNAQAGVLATANLLGYLALSAIGGALAARFGPRRVIAAGLAVAGAGMALTGSAAGFWQAVLWRVVTGLGSGAANVPAMGLLSSWFAPRRRGLAAGIAATGSSVALLLLGPAVPPVMAAYGAQGWRVCWFAFGAVTLGVAVLAILFLRNHPSELGLESVGAAAGSPVPAARGVPPPRWRDVYRCAAVWRLGVVYVAFGFSYIIYMTFFAKRLVAGAGYSAADAGRLFMTMGFFALLCGVVWGAVSDRIGRKWALACVYLIQAAAFALFALPSGRAAYTASAVLFGLTAWSIPAIMAAAAGDMVGARLAPAALGFVTVFFGAGQALGPSVAGIIADRTGSFAPVFLLASAVALLGALGSCLLRPAVAAGASSDV